MAHPKPQLRRTEKIMGGGKRRQRWVWVIGGHTGKYRIFRNPQFNEKGPQVGMRVIEACRYDAERGDPEAIAALLVKDEKA